MKFREHRGSLEESMKTIINVESLNDIQKLFPDSKKIEIKKYCYDDRINWDTFIVTDENGVLGFTNGNLNKKIYLKEV
jgi:hypothetical protein